MQDNFNMHSWRLKQAIHELEQKQCSDCGCKMEGTMCSECGYMEEGATFTGKHDDNPKLKGGQKDLPDEVQAKIVAEEVSKSTKEKAKNALAIHLRSAIEDGNKEGIQQIKDTRNQINSATSVQELADILGEFGYADDEIEDILG
jgi:hypothetical protein